MSYAGARAAVPRWIVVVAWLAVGLAVAASVIGYVLDLWEDVIWYDGAVHAYTTFAVTLLVGAYLYGRSLTGAAQYPILLIATVTAIGLGLGGAWEVVEWTFDRFSGGNFRIPDTAVDLLLDTAGALAAGVLLAIACRTDEEAPATVRR